MSIYVGWLHWGHVRIYNEATSQTNFHDITEVTSDLSTLDKALNELRTILKGSKVKHLVFVHNCFDAKACKKFVQKSQNKGFVSVYIQYWVTNHFQTILLKNAVSLAERQHLLLFVEGKAEGVTLWCHRENRVEFVKLGAMISSTDEDTNAFSNKMAQLLRDFDIRLSFNLNCPRASAIVRKLKPECEIMEGSSERSPFNADEYCSTALWSAQRQSGLVHGPEVGNFSWEGLKLWMGGSLIFDNVKDGLPLPFRWSTAKCKQYKSALTVSAVFDGLNSSAKLPTDCRCRIVVKADRNGLVEVDCECKDQPQVLAISFSENSFHLARLPNAADGTVVTIGKFGTALRFDCDPPQLAVSVNDPEVIADAIEMLDPSKHKKEGWMRLRTYDDTIEFCKIIGKGANRQVITPSYVVSELFKNIKSLVRDFTSDPNRPVCIALSRFFTQKQREKLTRILSCNQQKISFVDEILAATYGFMAEDGKHDSVTLVVDLRATGCFFVFVKITNDCCEHVVRKNFSKLKAESVRKAMQELSSEAPTTGSMKHAKAETTNVLAMFRDAVFDVVGKEHTNMSTVLLIGSCCLVPQLKDFFFWSFVRVKIVSLEEAEVNRLAAVGAVLLTLRPQSLSAKNLCPQ